MTNVSGTTLTVSAGDHRHVGLHVCRGVAVDPDAHAGRDQGRSPSRSRRTTAALNTYTGGQLTWTGGGYTVRSPIVVRPVAPCGSGVRCPAAGRYTVTFGYNGASRQRRAVWSPAAVTAGDVSDDPTDSTCSLTSPNAELIPATIPAGTTYARFSLFDADVSPGTDLDLCVFNTAGTLVGSSGSGTSAEEVNLLNPAAGTYTVVVQGWGVVGSDPVHAAHLAAGHG